MDPRSLVWLTVILFFIGYSTWTVLHSQQDGSDNMKNRRSRLFHCDVLGGNPSIADLKVMKSSIMMFLALMSLSPVLRTLTAATSSDSIWALSAALFALNALLADYTATTPANVHEGFEFFLRVISDSCALYRITSVFSMNAAVSASVVLASRLSTDVSVFSLMLFSIQSFALYPILRHRLQVSLLA